MNDIALRFEPINLELHSSFCIRFAEETELCSFGSVDGFRGNDGQGARRFLERIAAKQSEDPLSCFHVFQGQSIVGQLHLGRFVDPSIGYINFLYVVPAGRGTGIAQQVERYAMNFFEQRGLAAVRLSVAAANTRAFRFYLRCGWKDLGPREDKLSVHNMEKATGPSFNFNGAASIYNR